LFKKNWNLFQVDFISLLPFEKKLFTVKTGVLFFDRSSAGSFAVPTVHPCSQSENTTIFNMFLIRIFRFQSKENS